MKCKNLVTYAKTKFSNKVRDHCHYTGKFRVAAHSIAI